MAAGRALDFVSVLFRLGFTLDDFFDGLVDDGLFFRPCDRSGSGSFRGLGLGDDFVRSGENGIVIEFFFLDRRFLFDGSFLDDLFDRSFFLDNGLFDDVFLDGLFDRVFCRSVGEQLVSGCLCLFFRSFVGRVDDFERLVFAGGQIVELLFGELFDFKAFEQDGFEVPKVHVDLVDAVSHFFDVARVLIDSGNDVVKGLDDAFEQLVLSVCSVQVEPFFQAFQVSYFFGQFHVGVLSFSKCVRFVCVQGMCVYARPMYSPVRVSI